MSLMVHDLFTLISLVSFSYYICARLTSWVTQTVKNLPKMWETQVQSLG